MQIQVNFGSIPSSAALSEHVENELLDALAHLTDRLTRIEVHLGDTNSAARHGPEDKRCLLEARPKGLNPIAVEHFGDDIYETVTTAAGKLRRALTTRFEKLDDA
jgi:hypothetical protein